VFAETLMWIGAATGRDARTSRRGAGVIVSAKMSTYFRLFIFSMVAIISACGKTSQYSVIADLSSSVDLSSSADRSLPEDMEMPLDAAADPGPTLARISGWSIKKRERSGGQDFVLEEQLTAFTVETGTTRIRQLLGPSPERIWVAPAGFYIEDFSVHPSGSVSTVMVDESFHIWLARLSSELAQLDLAQLHDPAIAEDPTVPNEIVPVEVVANPLSRESVRITDDGEQAVVVAYTDWGSVIIYRMVYDSGWESARRTLVQPAFPHIPFLPTGGTFDTFGAIGSSFRALLDVDTEGNVFVAFWAIKKHLSDHALLFNISLVPVPPDPDWPKADSDILLAKFDRQGKHIWSRVVGTAHEDEPYALRTAAGKVAVVGRSRRLPGDDNTYWDALVSVTEADGTPVGTRTLQLFNSSILLGVDVLLNGKFILGGSEGWAQNPSGLSIISFGTKLLFELSSLESKPIRLPLPAGPRNNEVHSVQADANFLWYAGHEDGPIMHTGDGDLSQIHATGIAGFLAR
jgi:hypothetical protein